MAKRKYWKRGEKSALAASCGMSRPYLSGILNGTRKVSPAMADTIAKKAAEMGLDLIRIDLLYPEESTNPLLHSRVFN